MKPLSSFLTLIACLSYFSINTQMASAKSPELNPIDSIFSDEVMIGCEFKGARFSDLYFSGFDINRRQLKNGVLYIDNSSRYNMSPQYTTGLPVVKFSDIKAISEIKHNTREKIENIIALDIDISKHNLNISRFANFSGHYYAYKDGKFLGDAEGSGFYYVIKGLPEKNIPKLKTLVKAYIKKPLTNEGLPNNMIIEKTSDNNTRVICNW